MAMQAGMGLSRIIILVGAGFTGTVLLRNGKLSDVLADLQALVKGLEKSGEKNADADHSDALASQVRRLALEVRHLATARPITVLNGNSSQGTIATLVMPAAALGALGYCYMWWKGISFSDMMYVTKRNMSNAVANMTKHLEQVSSALAAAKKQLAQRIEGLNNKLDSQKKMTESIQNEVAGISNDLKLIGFDLDALQRMVSGLDGKICSLEDKQDYANAGVLYLCQFVGGAKDPEMAKFFQGLPKPANRRPLELPKSETVKGLQGIADIESGNIDISKTNAVHENNFDSLDKNPRCLNRTASMTASIKYL
ncbi:uncharacterized protein LOC18431953 [Amborella trichopoda]|uniref:uncharacterized protein LOC18431953 n=1 Tax=Amborella trichopoda TaxID=13333 RepID=UPI0005D30CF0|nr:uncharacterized protein LOC18431953 [Amborella trichopoda]|eukprot:XP_011622503.1 uncharacterized protein LOC18431953 [Amborella trichopoda]